MVWCRMDLYAVIYWGIGSTDFYDTSKGDLANYIDGAPDDVFWL